MARRYYSSTAVATTLSASANNSATSITVTALSGYPNQFPFTAILDPDTASEEVVTVSAVAGTTLTVIRGVDGTSGVSHNAGAVFRHGVSARDFDEANAFVNGGGVVNSLVNAKGDLIGATANDTPAILTAGTNEHRLVAASGEALGLKYVADTTNFAVAAKGDLLVGSAADTVVNLGVGTNGHVLTADSAETSGVKWAAAAAGGKVLQVVSTAKTDTFTTTVNTYTEVTGLSASITPSSATSKILVIMSLVGQRSAATDQVGQASVFRGSTNLVNPSSPANRTPAFTSGVQMGDTNGNVNTQVYSFTFLDAPGSTSALSYNVRVKTASGSPETFFVNRGELDSDIAAHSRGVSTITVMEIGA